MEEQKAIVEKGASMRLGAYACHLTEHTHAWRAYQAGNGRAQPDFPTIHERHRHRYEFNNAYLEALTQHGLIISGVNPETNLVEICEVPDHPWMVGVQFHPEFQSKPNKAHPLFAGFVAAALRQREARG